METAKSAVLSIFDYTTSQEWAMDDMLLFQDLNIFPWF